MRAVIFDVDGTLCNVRNIRHFLPNFDKFHRASIDCPPHFWVVWLARLAKLLGFKVIIVTARKAKYRNVTAFWLAMHKVPSDVLIMRGDRDDRPDFAVKQDILNQLADFDIKLAVDDNPNVINVWRNANIPVIKVRGYSDHN